MIIRRNTFLNRILICALPVKNIIIGIGLDNHDLLPELYGVQGTKESLVRTNKAPSMNYLVVVTLDSTRI